jgi:hypothetical protein
MQGFPELPSKIEELRKRKTSRNFGFESMYRGSIAYWFASLEACMVEGIGGKFQRRVNDGLVDMFILCLEDSWALRECPENMQLVLDLGVGITWILVLLLKFNFCSRIIANSYIL